MQVWKYELAKELLMPKGAEIIKVEFQDGHLTMWVTVDPYAKQIKRHFEIFGTGHDIPKHAVYVHTYFDGSGFVWHIFELFGVEGAQ
jgi:hypothetical protein